MRILKKITLVIIILAGLLVIAIFIYINRLKPAYYGNLKIPALQQEVSVYFDDYGIPHIYAQNQLDATTALGYVHAQDRLWQMELLRRIAPGKLSEIFGKVMLKNDIFFSKLGIEESSETAIKNLDKNSDEYKLATAYLNGVNQFIKTGPTPIEFTLTGVPKESFNLKDIYNIFGYMSFSFAMAQKTDPLLSILKAKLGDQYLNDLNILSDKNTTINKTYPSNIPVLEEMVASINNILEKSPSPPFVGSNSWVVSAAKTSTGQVLFANDPHIMYSQPAVWYEAHVVTPDYEMYGYHIAGIPFPLLGHNRNYAFGLTMFENDDLDFYEETINPADSTQYKTPVGYETFKKFKKTIQIKDENPLTITVKTSLHGPIMNGATPTISQTNPIALSWIYTKTEINGLQVLYTLSHAKSMADVKKAASMLHAPGLNIMYGDAKGNIAWWAAGKLYKLKSNSNRKFVLNGASGMDDIDKFIDFNQNPMAENPTWNYVYSANNQPDSIAETLYPGYYVPEDRAKRITHLLTSKNDWDKQAFEKMLVDNTSVIAIEIIKEFSKNLQYNTYSKKERQAINMLQLWDGSNNIDEIAPTIYNKWVYLYLKNTFEDEMGSALFQQFLNTHLAKREIADLIIKKPNSVWWDNVQTKDKVETENDILSTSLKQAVADLEKQLGNNIAKWQWGKVHTLENPHPLGAVSYLRKFFNVGPFPISGTNEVINNTGFTTNNIGLYPAKLGPSTRRIIDFSDVENSVSILPTGESGNVFSKHYKDQAEMYIHGKFRKMKMNKQEIIKVSTLLKMQPN